MPETVTASAMNTSASPGPDTVRIEDRDGTVVLAVHGGIDAVTASSVRDALAWAISRHERVVVDLSRAASIDRAGLGVLIAAQDRANSRAVQLCFTAPSPQLLTALCDLRADEALAAVDGGASPREPQPADELGFTLPRPPCVRFSQLRPAS
jgi:anti-anti-sigma factor